MDILIRIAGGVALLLWGLHMTRTGLLRGFGQKLRQSVQWSAERRSTAFAAGVGLAAMLQSSMAVITIAASLSGKKLLSAATVLVVALGADLGSALAAQLAGHAIGWLSPLLIVLGVLAFESGEQSERRNLGRAMIGIGLILLSLDLLKAAFAPFGASPTLLDVIAALAAQPILLVLVAAMLAVLTHSGLAIVVIVATLAEGGLVGPDAGLYMVLGANLGSGLAALLATRSMPGAMRIGPMANVLARLGGTALGLAVLWPALPFLPDLEAHWLVLGGHLVFNAVLALVALPFADVLVRLATRLVPAEVSGRSANTPLHLDIAQLADDDLALGNARREVVRIADMVQVMLADVAGLLQGPHSHLEPGLASAEDQVDDIYRSIKLYAAEFMRLHGRTEASAEMRAALTFATELEHIGDVIIHNLARSAARKNKSRRAFSDEGMQEILSLHELVLRNMKLATNAFVSGDTRLARAVIEARAEVHAFAQQSTDNHFDRIVNRSPASLETGTLHVDVLRDLKRINSHLVKLGQLALEVQKPS